MKQFIPTLDEYINEIEKLPYKQWINFNLQSLDKETMELIWNMYITTYGMQGIDFSANDIDDLQKKYSAIFLMDIDKDSLPDAFIIYRETEFGKKIALSGTNGKKEAKDLFLKRLFELILNTKGWYCEGSLKIDQILKSKNAPYIDNEQIVRTVLKKDITWEGDGYYIRKLSRADKYIRKRIYGTPNI